MDYEILAERLGWRWNGRYKFKIINARGKKFLSYYKPYRGLFLADMAAAFILSATTLLLPLGANVITKNLGSLSFCGV